MTKCVGCGIKLQEKDKNELGYTPNLNNALCERCFKLKNYNVLTNKGINIDNDKLINKINELNTCVLFLVDFINLDSEVIDAYKKIKSKKILIITKADIIPKNIKYQKLIQNIKNIYDIKEDLILTSSKTKLNIKTITKICLEEKNICLAGFTNAGKSSLINALVGSDITVSKKSNTTQDFIKLNVDGINIYDAPGFMSNINRENIPRSIIRPITYQFPSRHYLLIQDIKLNILENSNFTIYVGNEANIIRRKENENVECKIIVPKNSDVIIKGFCFINFKNTCMISLNTKDYEIRPSIVGDYND
ncbi:MAG: 50S ribosome-binding GTPase [Firmicutes bacterium]|nr:50S ribosome-binding GTPase [Bacillota bacterium]